MSLFARLRPKWQHADPAVREQAVRTLDDQVVLAKVASDDAVDSVRLEAVQRLTDQRLLARLASGAGALALPAMQRLTDRAHVSAVALSAERIDVRRLAVDKIDDRVLLHRIATSDTDSWIRAKARNKGRAPDQTRDYLRSELSKLQLAQRKAQDVAEICGSLDDICSALTGNGPFRINAGVDRGESIPSAAANDSSSNVDVDCAQFLALKHDPTNASVEPKKIDVFYNIMVWRTDQDTFACRTEEKRLKVMQDTARWIRVSNGSAPTEISRRETTAQA